jgi:hypothetical protein
MFELVVGPLAPFGRSGGGAWYHTEESGCSACSPGTWCLIGGRPGHDVPVPAVRMPTIACDGWIGRALRRAGAGRSAGWLVQTERGALVVAAEHEAAVPRP